MLKIINTNSEQLPFRYNLWWGWCTAHFLSFSPPQIPCYFILFPRIQIKWLFLLSILWSFANILQKLKISCIIFCLGIKVYSVITVRWLELNLTGAGYILLIDMIGKYYIQVIKKVIKRYSSRILFYETYKLEILLCPPWLKHCF